MGAVTHPAGGRNKAGWLRTVAGVGALLLAVPAVAAAQPSHEAARTAGQPSCTITGTNGPNVLVGGPGRDVICGLGGNDVIRGAGGNDILRGGSGNDVLVGGAGNDELVASTGKDVLRGGSGNDVLRGGSGNNRLFGDSGNDEIHGGWGTDVLYGGTGADRLYGGYGNDRLDGGSDGDLLLGGPDADVITGGTGNDQLAGGSGNDSLRAVDGAPYRDLVGCGTGTDTAYADGADTVTGCERGSWNAAPHAVDDSFGGTEDTVLVLPRTGVGSPVANDTDPDGNPLSVTGVSGAVGGTVAIVAAEIRFTPAANLCSPSAGRFDYTVSDGHGGTDTGRVAIPLTCVPDDPTATDDEGMVPEDAGATALTVLANDVDPDGDPLVIDSVTQPDDGAVSVTGGGSGLTYTPAPNFCSGTPDTFTYTLTPGGSTATVSIIVVCSDDPPVAVNDAATVAQDAEATPVDVLANDTDIDLGPKTIASATDPAHGTVALTGGVPGASTGLTYQPDANYCNDPPGNTLDTFTYTLTGGSSATVTMTVTCPNAPPTAVADAAGVNEDAGASAIDVLGNDTDADGGPKAIASTSDPANGTVVLTGGSPGAHTGLTYQPDPNYCNDPPGTALDTFTYTLNGGSTATVSVTVTCVDDNPVAAGDAATVIEDSGATGIDVLANDNDVDGGPKAIASASDPANGTVVLTGGSPGAHTGLTYQPEPDYCNNPPGTALDTFTYTLNGGSTATVSVTVTCVTDSPTVTNAAGPTTYTENGAPLAVDSGVVVSNPDAAALTGAGVSITDGYGFGDTLDWTDNNPSDSITEGVSTVQTIVLTGTGTAAEYTAALRAVTYVNTLDDPDTAARTVTFSVDAPGSPSDTIELDVTAVDDPPVAVNDLVLFTEDSAATAVPVLANDTDVDGGAKSIVSASDPGNGTVVITGGGTGLTYQPDPDYCNAPPGTTPDTFTYTLNGGSIATVSVAVTCVNDAPVADDVTFSGANNAIGNTALIVDDPTDGAPTLTSPNKTISGDILAGATDVDSPGSLAVVPGTLATNDGGSVTVEADGDFVFTPSAGTSCTDTSDFFDYTVTDQDPTDPKTDVGRVTVSLTGCVWYVSNNASGNSGTSTAPFDTLAQAQTASAAGQTIYVFDGDGTSAGYAGGIVLKDNQLLIGEAAQLQVAGNILAAPGSRPTIAANNADVVTLAAGNTLRGLRIDPQGTGGGIAGGSGDAGGTIDDIQIIDTATGGTEPALELNGTSGTFDVSSLTVDNTAASGQTSGSVGVRLNNAGTVNFLPSGTIAISTVGAKALDVTGTTSLGATSVFDSVTVAGSGTGAVSLNGNTGTATFANLSLTTTSGSAAAFALTNTGGVAVSAGGTANVNATGGPAVDVSGSTNPSLSFDAVSSTGSAGTGINLAGLGSGTFSATSGTIAGATGTAFAVSGASSGTITYPGAIGNGAGLTASISGRTGGALTLSGTLTDDNDAGGGVAVSGNSGGSTVLSGSAKTFDTGAGNGVSITTSPGHTVSITGGGLAITTGAGNGLTVSGGGTFAVTGSGNTITTGTGNGLTIDGTTIGAGNVTFQKVTTNGAAVGIRASNTGASGRLIVTGNGGVCTSGNTSGCSGGTLANGTGVDDSGATPTGTGIVLNNTLNPSFTRMFIHDHANYGIRGTAVAGFTLDTSVVNGTNGNNGTTPYDEASIAFDDLTGSAAVSNTYVSGGYEDNVRVVNSSGSLDRITFTGDTIGDNSAVGGNDGVLLSSNGGAGALKATVTTSTFTGAAGDLLQFDHNGSGAGDLVLTGSTFSNNHPGIATGGGGLSLGNGGGSGTTTMSITGNSFRDAVGNALTIVKSTGGSSQSGTFDSNTVGVSGSANTGSAEGDGLKLQSAGGGTLTWAVTNNTIRQYNNFGIEVLAGGSASAQSGNVNATITGNNIAQPGNTAGTLSVPKNGVHLNIGTVVGDTYNACAAITGNTLAGSGVDGVPPAGGGQDVRIRERQSTTIRLPGYGGANNDNAAVQTFVANNNPTGGVPTVIATNTVSTTGGGFVGGAACPLP